ncbi:hypothetical protein AVEN_258165-1 [Araneus ventricosus]|uniref:Uncharacterized protein n=1 Tax=Araneus ventricosus TaxID=182803 RepID=A0A4Y2AKV3_ARAVE|nr:hypothetical protein AVEN_248001-1 [Araneus ventricosus]GBL79100.1 hypothetical protein AVEN_59554-1 [Araneus ventricosus]GBL79121.1 hypothetical protein AVEN_86685-1 [Araneus ventricosus]GBL80277.1 hypothetical protein AVEN_258165-1 [Araneus ventricosus]
MIFPLLFFPIWNTTYPYSKNQPKEYIKAFNYKELNIPRNWCGSFERWDPVQASSSTSDRSSKCRGLVENIPRVASKRDANITESKTKE